MYFSDFFKRLMIRVNGFFNHAKCDNLPPAAMCTGSFDVKAKSDVEITAVGDVGDEWTLEVDEGGGATAISTYVVQTGDTEAMVIAGLIANLSGGYSAVDNMDGTMSLLAPAGEGAGGNAFTGTLTSDGTGTATVSTFTGGVDAS